MHHTFKGIYIKSQWSDEPSATAEISNVLYEDVIMDGPTQARLPAAHAWRAAWDGSPA